MGNRPKPSGAGEPEVREEAGGDTIEDLELDDAAAADAVSGGRTPSPPPGGPVPIPYPNVTP